MKKVKILRDVPKIIHKAGMITYDEAPFIEAGEYERVRVFDKNRTIIRSTAYPRGNWIAVVNNSYMREIEL